MRTKINKNTKDPVFGIPKEVWDGAVSNDFPKIIQKYKKKDRKMNVLMIALLVLGVVYALSGVLAFFALQSK